MRVGGRRLTRAAARGLVVLAAGGFVAPAATASGLHVIPFPGTPDASPLSHIIFSSLDPSDIQTVTVTGSTTGPHGGRLVALPDRAGTAFMPHQPFAPGERVTVSASLASPSAGTRSGDPGAVVLHFSFRVAVAANQPMTGTARPPGGQEDHTARHARSLAVDQPTQRFHSVPWLHPPVITATHDPDVVSGDIFLGPTHSSRSAGGAMILDSQGRLVWFDPVGYVAGLQVQRYQHQPVLTWWQSEGKGLADGEGVIMNRSYRIVKTVHAGYGYGVDSHEFQITRQGTAFIEAAVPVKADLRSVGGPADGSAVDCIVQEIDIRTGEVLWEWHALGHVPLTASYQPPTGGSIDYFHLNSIQPLPNGNLIISARNTWGVYEIDKQTGRVIWTLGGKHPSFKMGPGTNFEWQHDARLHPGGMLTLFDDGALPQEERQSSAKLLRLNTATMTASLAQRYRHNPPLLSSVTGSAQIVHDGNVFVGWGSQPDFSEYTRAGKQIFTASMPVGLQSYRAFRFPWHAAPLTRPVVAVAPQHDGTVRVYVTWNGATQVAAWRVRGGARRGGFQSLAQARRGGFETMIRLHSRPAYLAVQALNAHGKVIGTSRVHKL